MFRMNPRVWLLSVSILFAVLGTSATGFGQGLQIRLNASSPDSKSAEAQIQESLDRNIDIIMFEDSLEAFASTMSEALEITIAIDQLALEDIGLSPEVPLTAQIENITARAALNLVLRPLDLTFTIRDQILVITTIEEAEATLVARVYNITDLAATSSFDPKMMPWKTPITDADQIIGLIYNSVAHDTWSQVGGPGDIQSVVIRDQVLMVVSQTLNVHDEIDALLSLIRLEMASVTPVEVDAPLPVDDSDANQNVDADEQALMVRIYPLRVPDGTESSDYCELVEQVIAYGDWDSREDVQLEVIANWMLVRHEPPVQVAVRQLLSDLGVLTDPFDMLRRQQLIDLELYRNLQPDGETPDTVQQNAGGGLFSVRDAVDAPER